MAFRPSLSSPRLFLESVSLLAVVRSSVRQCRVYSSSVGGRGEAPTTARGRRMQKTALLRRNRRNPELERAARTGTCKTILLPKSCTHSPPPPRPFLSLSVSAPLTQDFLSTPGIFYPTQDILSHPGYFIPPGIFYPHPGYFIPPRIFYPTWDILSHPGYFIPPLGYLIPPRIFYSTQDILSHPGYFIPPRIFYPTRDILSTPGIFYPTQDILSHPGYFIPPRIFYPTQEALLLPLLLLSLSVSVPLGEVQKEWQSHRGLGQLQTAGHHFNLYQDLYGGRVFRPGGFMEVTYGEKTVHRGTILPPSEVSAVS